MDVDLVITELEVGGAERCLASLACFLRRQNHRVRVVSLGPKPSSEKSQLVDAMARSGVELHFLNGTGWWQLPKIYRRLHRLVQQRPPEIAQSFLFHANVVSAMVYGKTSVPLIGGVRVAEPRRWRHRLGGIAAKRMAKIVCVSKSVADWCMKYERIPEAKLAVIPNGIELMTRGPKLELRRSLGGQFKIDPASPWLLFVGRLDHQKGIDELLKRTPSLLARLPHHQLILIGDGPLRGDVEKAVQSSDAVGRAHWIGWQANPRDWMAASQLLLLPARYEGMPNVVLEAMAEGIAVACTRVEGIEEVLGDEAMGQTSKAADFDTWTDLVVRLASDDQLCSDLGARNQHYATQQHSLERRLLEYIRLYTEVLDRRA